VTVGSRSVYECDIIFVVFIHGEESPDSAGQRVLLMEDTADYIPREGKRHRKQTVIIPQGRMIRVKRRGKSSPDDRVSGIAGQAPLGARPNRGQCRGPRRLSPGYWSQRQMIAIPFARETESGLFCRCHTY